MGNILGLSTDQIDDPHTAPDLKITLDFEKPVHIEVKQLLHWSLTQIRNIYAPFRKRKSSPLLTRSQFLRFVRISRISAFHIYDCLCEQAEINAFEVMAILVLTAYTTYTYKIQFLVIVFDLLSQRTLKFSDLMLMFKSVVRGFALLTRQPLPDIQLLEKYAQTVFMRADLNNDQNLQLSEIVSWVQENKDALALFKSFEPKNNGKEDYHIFNLFSPYTSSEVDVLLARIRKVHYKEKVEEQDYHLLRAEEALFSKQSSKENLFRITTGKDNIRCNNSVVDLLKSKEFSSSKLEMSTSTQFRTASRLLVEKNNTIKLPTFNGSNLWRQSSRNKFTNIIIIKGRTITKKDIFDLRDYFERLSSGKDFIMIEDFIDSFSQEKYNHMKSVAASLYNFLDQDQNGKVTFKELLLKIYPNLTSFHLTVVDHWIEEYAANFNIKQRTRPNRRQEESKKRVLPKTCMNRFKQMFSFYDQERKGYITLEDMQRVLSEVCTEAEILDLFQESDKDQDGKLSLQEFANVILPSDLEIQGL